MKKRWKKALCITTAAAIALAAAGCGGENSKEEKKDAGTAAGREESQDKGEKVQLTIWSLYGTNPDDKSAVAFQESIKEIMEEDPTLDIQLDYAENEA